MAGKSAFDAKFDAAPKVTAFDAKFNAAVSAGESKLPDDLQGLPLVEEKPEPGWLEPKSMSGTAMRHFAQTGSQGFSDELGGAMGVLDEGSRRVRAGLGMKFKGDEPIEGEGLSMKDALVSRFRRERGAGRSELDTGAKENPKVAFHSGLVGAIAAPSPFGKAKGMWGGIKAGIKLGGLNGLGASNADLTRGDVAGAASDTLAGAEAGGAVGMALAPVGAIAERGSRGLRRMAGEVRSDKMGKIKETLDKEISSAQGARDSATQAASRTGENIQRTVQGVDSPRIGSAVVDPETQRRALLSLSDPEFKKMMTSVASNSVDNVPRRNALMASTGAKYAELVAGRDATANKQLADYFAPGQVLSKEVLPRSKTLAVNIGTGTGVGMAAGGMAAAGAVMTGHSGAALPAFGTGLLGGITTAVGGGTGLKRMLFGSRGLASSPRVQNAALESIAANGERAVRGPINTLSQQAGTKSVDQRDEEAIQAYLDGT